MLHDCCHLAELFFFHFLLHRFFWVSKVPPLLIWVCKFLWILDKLLVKSRTWISSSRKSRSSGRRTRSSSKGPRETQKQLKKVQEERKKPGAAQEGLGAVSTAFGKQAGCAVFFCFVDPVLSTLRRSYGEGSQVPAPVLMLPLDGLLENNG